MDTIHLKTKKPPCETRCHLVEALRKSAESKDYLMLLEEMIVAWVTHENNDDTTASERGQKIHLYLKLKRFLEKLDD